MTGKAVRVLVKIPNGTALSGEIDVSAYEILAIQGAAAWTAAALSFQGRASTGAGSDQSTTPPTAVPAPVLGEVLDDAAAAVVVQMSANAYVVLTGPEKEALQALRYMKVRSGLSGAPVNQAADRYLWLIVAPLT